ncbi:MAG: tetratricopeptide repeat protein [Candidatus Obscuribacterales bacterium]|nr:tetratricopeptide repeat protein [Candidatus Obscuribacterales bacterium]
MSRHLSVSVLVIFAAFAFYGTAAMAEGFPGIGDRVQYAESLPHYNLGNRYLTKKWYEKAVEKYRDAIEIYPYDADVYSNLGVALRHLNDPVRAEWAYKRAVELKGDDWTSLNNLANLYMLQDRFEESLKLFKKTLQCKDLPKSEKEVIESNIEGINKIMKNRGLQAAASRAKKAPQAKAAPGEKGVVAGKTNAKSSQNQASYESWLDN